MERRVRWKSHARCESGEKLEITSNSYLSILRVSKLFKEYVGGGQYENKEDVKRYKVELKSDRMLLHPLD